MMPNVGAGASMMIFFFLCAAQVIIGLGVFSYAAHSFLTIVVDTAAGADHVLWPAEPFTDWLWKPWYLTWLIAVWLTPIGLILALLKFTAIQIALAGLILFWLIFPVGLLSSLSATTRWAVFRPVMVWYLLRHFPSTAVFYMATELLLGVWGVVAYVSFRFHDWALLLPFTALTAAAVLFLYGRLVGRLAWVLNQRRLGPQEEVEEIVAEAQVEDPWGATAPVSPRQETEDPAVIRSRNRTRRAAEDPWAVPPEGEDPDSWKRGLPRDVREAGQYEILRGEPRAVPVKKSTARVQPQAVYAAEPVVPEKKDVSWLTDEIPEREQELARREPETPPPAWPMVSGVYSFLGYPATLGPLLTVALGFWLMGLVLRVQLSFFAL